MVTSKKLFFAHYLLQSSFERLCSLILLIKKLSTFPAFPFIVNSNCQCEVRGIVGFWFPGIPEEML